MTALFVILTISAFILVDYILNRRTEAARASQPVVFSQQPLRIPDGIFFSPSHTWLNLFPSGKVRIGVDDFVARMLNNPEITFLKQPGDIVARGESLLRLKEKGHELTVYSPIEGKVESVNEELLHNPEFLKTSLFQNGWSFVVKPRRTSDLKQFILGSESRTWIQREFGRLRDMFALSGAPEFAPAMLQDGGPVVANAMDNMDQRVWQQFENDFMKVS
jgi:glycine cleavage system H protein